VFGSVVMSGSWALLSASDTSTKHPCIDGFTGCREVGVWRGSA